MVQTSTIIIATAALTAASSLARPIEHDHFVREEDDLFVRDETSPFDLATRELDERSWFSTAEKVGKGALKVAKHLPSNSNSNSQNQQPQQHSGFFGKVGGFLGLREEDALSARDYEDSIYGREFPAERPNFVSKIPVRGPVQALPRFGPATQVFPNAPRIHSKIPIREGPVPSLPRFAPAIKTFPQMGLATRELDERGWFSAAEHIGKGAFKVAKHLPSNSNSNSQNQQPQQHSGFFGKVEGFLGLREEDELSARDYEDSIYGRELPVEGPKFVSKIPVRHGPVQALPRFGPATHGFPDAPRFLSKIPIREGPVRPLLPPSVKVQMGLAARELDERGWFSAAEHIGKGAFKVAKHLPSNSNSNSQNQQPQQHSGFLGKVEGFLGLREEDELSARDYDDLIYGREYAVDDLD